MEHSSKFFENRACQYFPCHDRKEDFNCLFCYCPMYHIKNCPGNPTFKEKNGKELKICTDCTFPHVPEHYDLIMEVLRSEIK